MPRTSLLRICLAAPESPGIEASIAAERFRLIEQLADQHAIAWLCRRLGVARSGYYAWTHRQQAPPGKRQAENAVITADIQAVFKEHRGFYGLPRIHQELRAVGRPIGRHRVARLMQRAGLRAKTRRAFRPCSKATGAAGLAENLLQQDFTPPAPNRCWAGDITISAPPQAGVIWRCRTERCAGQSGWICSGGVSSIDGYYNRERRHSTLNHLNPIDDEQHYTSARTLTTADP